MCLVWILHISGVIPYVIFCTWLLALIKSSNLRSNFWLSQSVHLWPDSPMKYPQRRKTVISWLNNLGKHCILCSHHGDGRLEKSRCKEICLALLKSPFSSDTQVPVWDKEPLCVLRSELTLTWDSWQITEVEIRKGGSIHLSKERLVSF